MTGRGIRYALLVLAVAMTCLCGCSKFKQIRPVSASVESIVPTGLRSVAAVVAVEIDNPAAQLAMSKLPQLTGCQMHFTHIVPEGDLAPLRKLGVTFTCDPVYTSKNLFME